MSSLPTPSVPPSEVGGYVLAGGKSSRMRTDKALLELAGKPLIEHAVRKLRRVCTDVFILSSNPELTQYAPLVADLHPDCGPIGGIEAALAHTTHDWNLILPVDLPFLPAAFLDAWISRTLAGGGRGVRIALFTVDGVPQPTLLLIHRAAAAYLGQAVSAGSFKLLPALEFAGQELAASHGGGLGCVMSDAPPDPMQSRWFANLNTPEEFAEAEKNIDALDPVI
jgi:molybdopterin-guanine dinucleotide biosynthesis protein A